ncbi:zinc finger protein-like [Tropilaelaps mercedesae]|uniref:Zinc finger protein-like n=1 Tax=Tropilaelaps mercedesae TaxID=418985 RepID=A0A1V9X7L6_9ACAR|nr:zinc finger protein-like [Tropilaelaps mercedesae]
MPEWFVTASDDGQSRTPPSIIVKQEATEEDEEDDTSGQLVIAEDDLDAGDQQDCSGSASLSLPLNTRKPIIDATMNSEGFITCNQCEYKCKNPQTIRYHMYKHQPGVKKPFQCPYCPFSAYMRSHLANHILIHTGERPQACPLCTYRARERTALKRHLKAKHKIDSIILSPQRLTSS